MKTGLHLQVRGHVSRLGQIHQILVDIDTGAQISCVSEQWALEYAPLATHQAASQSTDQQWPQNSECSSAIIRATGYSFLSRMVYYCNTTPPTVFSAAGRKITQSPKRVSGERGRPSCNCDLGPAKSFHLVKSFHGPELITTGQNLITARSRPADHRRRPERQSVSFAMGQTADRWRTDDKRNYNCAVCTGCCLPQWK